VIDEIESAPPFVPVVTPTELENEGWSFDRFLVLVLGEIPTLAACGPWSGIHQSPGYSE
jgi:hypothetical protein